MPGMTLAIEPMITAGGWQVKVLPDGWRAVRAASRNELRDFAFNWGYARR